MRRLARNVALVLATLCVAVVLWHIREGVVLFAISLAVAAAVRPTVDELVRHRWPKSIALVVTYFTGLTLAALLALLLSNPLMEETRHASNKLLLGYEHVTSRWTQGTMLERALASRLPAPAALSETLTGEHGLALAQTALGITWNLFENVIRVIMVLVLSIYWSLDRVHFESLWLSLLPGDLRAEMRDMWHDMESGVGAYLRSEVVRSIVAGLLLAGGYSLLGLDYVALLTMIGAFACLLPWIGVVVALVPAWFVGWQAGLGLAIAAAVYTLAVFLLLKMVVEPRFFNRRRYNPLLAALVALALAELFGLVGLIIGPPIAVALQIYFAHWLRRSSPAPDLALDLGSLEVRIAAMRATLEQTEPPPPELVSMLERLSTLVRDAGSALEPQGQALATAAVAQR
ncbi:MAG TPA: AI-2E family transporter [Pirellulales bacterium]|nr:AI-2E family transporter [Pirellulales bacterium]